MSRVGFFVRSWRRRRIRGMMRGYRRLRDQERLDWITDAKDALTAVPLTSHMSELTHPLFGAGGARAEAAFRQYLLVRVGYLSLNRALLRSLGGHGALAHPIPKEWAESFAQQGFDVSLWRCAWMWRTLGLALWAHGLVTIIKVLVEGVSAAIRGDRTHPNRYAFFCRLDRTNLPRTEARGGSRDILSWYAYWGGRPQGVQTLCHDVIAAVDSSFAGLGSCAMPVSCIRGPIPPLTALGAWAAFLVWAVRAAATALLDWCRGLCAAPILLSEAALAAKARLTRENLAVEYLFHNSGWIYRPLWTYEAEARGSKTTFYFYSTNCESFKRPGYYPTQENYWQVITWPRYLVWDRWQADFVRRAVGEGADLQEVGPIWFAASVGDVPKIPAQSVAVFDVQPRRPALYQELACQMEYFVPSVAIAFARDVYTAVHRLGMNAVFKQKRSIGRKVDRSYAKEMERLAAERGFIGLDPGVSAFSVIESCAAVISMPFTSTAIIARGMGKPSAYYDPSGIVQKDDRAAHGVPVLSGSEELVEWLRAVTDGLEVALEANHFEVDGQQ